MQPTLCVRCQKNVAVIFVREADSGKSVIKGLCLKCAKELNIKPVQDMIQQMGITEDDIDGISAEMTEALTASEEIPNSEEDGEDSGKTATFPFLNKLFGGNPPPPAPEQPRGGRDSAKPGEPAQQRGSKRKFLESYCQDLNDKARTGKVDQLVGRETELERVIQILNRRQKNNPCLIGEPGVGKTAIAEGLAQRIVDGKVPYKLQNKEVWLLDLTSLVAGTQFRGQFESRMKGLIDEIKKQGNIILFIDEVHSIVGAGDAEGSMNAANILKPALSRGEIQVVGATTFNEYRKHIEKDSALERRFQPVTVGEPSIPESIRIIEGIAHYYEEFHCVRISDEMCRQAVVLSERYITDRFLPDKAIDLLDEACSDVNLKNRDIARSAAIDKELADLVKERETILSVPSGNGNDYQQLATLRSRELQLEEELDALKARGWPELTMENLAHVIELWTKIPASSIQEDEYVRLNKLDSRLKQHLIGQDEAVDAVCAAIKRNRVGISAKRKPVSFIFVGSTGVGKTELVKQLAADLFDSPESLIRLDMSEFMEKHAVSRIMGSPPGYVGYDEAGQLTEKIRRKPYSVILFDEIEKAHPDVLNILLQILDDGHITDAHGRSVNFENTVIIMTTNAGSQYNGGNHVGFDRSVTEQAQDKAMKALKDFLRPEFLNRVDEVICFNKLTEENFVEIARMMMNELRDSIAEKGYTLRFDDELLKYLARKSYSVAYGARNLRRLIQKEVEDAMTQLILESYASNIRFLSVTAQDDKVQIVTCQPAQLPETVESR